MTEHVKNNFGELKLTDLAEKFDVTPAAIHYQLKRMPRKLLLRIEYGVKKVKYFINKITRRVLAQIRYYVKRSKLAKVRHAWRKFKDTLRGIPKRRKRKAKRKFKNLVREHLKGTKYSWIA